MDFEKWVSEQVSAGCLNMHDLFGKLYNAKHDKKKFSVKGGPYSSIGKEGLSNVSICSIEIVDESKFRIRWDKDGRQWSRHEIIKFSQIIFQEWFDEQVRGSSNLTEFFGKLHTAMMKREKFFVKNAYCVQAGHWKNLYSVTIDGIEFNERCFSVKWIEPGNVNWYRSICNYPKF